MTLFLLFRLPSDKWDGHQCFCTESSLASLVLRPTFSLTTARDQRPASCFCGGRGPEHPPPFNRLRSAKRRRPQRPSASKGSSSFVGAEKTGEEARVSERSSSLCPLGEALVPLDSFARSRASRGRGLQQRREDHCIATETEAKTHYLLVSATTTIIEKVGNHQK